MPRANGAPTRSLDDLTVGDLRRLVNGGLDESTTVGAALVALAEGDRASELHAADVNAYNAYVEQRAARCAAALVAAAAAADKAEATRRQGDGARMAARQAARVDADDTFSRHEPLLEFQVWIDAGRPSSHRLSAIQLAVQSVAAAIA